MIHQNVCLLSSIEEQQEATIWMNNNIYENKITFTAKYDGKCMQFLDTEIKVEKAQINDTRGLSLIPQIYSKPSDTHQYLHPLSCHPSHVTNNLPTAVVSRIRWNCSDNVDGIAQIM